MRFCLQPTGTLLPCASSYRLIRYYTAPTRPDRKHRMANRVLRIGGASGFWGDAERATPQLLNVAGLDYLVLRLPGRDHHVLHGRARGQGRQQGLCDGFCQRRDAAPLELSRSAALKLSPMRAASTRRLARGAARRHRAAGPGPEGRLVLGDDLMRAQGTSHGPGHDGDVFRRRLSPPDTVLSINAYLGAFPIAPALTAAPISS